MKKKNTRRYVYYHRKRPHYYYASSKITYKKNIPEGIACIVIACIWFGLICYVLAADNSMSNTAKLIALAPGVILAITGIVKIAAKLSDKKLAMNKAVEIALTPEDPNITSCDACGGIYVKHTCNACPYCDVPVRPEDQIIYSK